GTLFLDEIGDLGIASQIKLLRVIETGEYYALGSDILRRSKARIVVATNRDLKAEAAAGTFRKDLYYRLKAHHIEVPPLRERMCDLPFLVEHFVRRFEEESGLKDVQIPAKLLPILSTYDFPGNVRELESMLFDALNLGPPGKISLAPFLSVINASGPHAPMELSTVVFPARLPSIKSLTGQLVNEALSRTKGNQAFAARLLGISPQALSKRQLKKKGGLGAP
ncbi:MAG: sigma 54-interacting transcriptional regulator, partial [Spirochaetaceae bacterium]|nr:sigma 54-interacting transcriptional regulator [Spirochaetaceae bacterium]